MFLLRNKKFVLHPDHGLVHLISDEVIKSRGGSYALDAIVIIVSILSMLLCSRSVFRAQQLRIVSKYSKTCVKRPLKNRQNKHFYSFM